MDKKVIFVSIIILALGFLFLFLNPNEESNKVMVGWQPPWINQGQVAMVLQKTDILGQNGVQAEFIGFSFGPPMTEAALSGELDVLFLGDQPAFNLIAKDDSWKIVAPLVYYKSAILVPVNSNINFISDLKGKTIATGIGSTTYRDTIQVLTEDGLEQEEFTIKNLDVAEQLAFMQSNTQSWGEIDAIAAYDPTVSIAISKGLVKQVKEYKSLGVIAMNKKFYNEKPVIAKKFLESVERAFEYYQENKDEANEWYFQATRYTAPQELFEEMGSIEPKLQGQVDISLNQEILKELENHLNTAIELKLISEPLKIQNIVANINTT